jgi:hypothetical protein
MKNTMVFFTLFVFLFVLSIEKSFALVPIQMREDIKLVVTLVPTATPTPIIFKKIDPNINLKLIVTVTPTPTLGTKLTVTPEPTLGTKLTVTPEPSLETELTVTPKQEVVENIPETKVDLKMYFMGVIIALLAIIIAIQLLPKKKGDQ